MDNKTNPIEELFVDSDPVDLEGLISGIKPFIRVGRSDQSVFLTDEGGKLDAKRKILVYALAKLALKLGGVEESGSISASEVKKTFAGSIPDGTVDAYFKDLREKGLLIGKGKTYTVPSYKVSSVVKHLGEIR